MITKPTVLVLGAGVSYSYGYPTGMGLMNDIFTQITSNAWREVYGACGLDHKEMDALKSELYLSHKPSIDAFLEYRRDEFLKPGKVAIALSLLSRENPDTFHDFSTRDNGIYDFLYHSLATSWDEFKENRLTIITFNYDRSLEHFLFSALKHSYNKTDAQVAEMMQFIPIVHVHGSLGPLPWQEPGGIDYYPLFGRRDDAYQIGRRIKVASENIVIVSEAEPESKEFAFAIKSIKEAQRIYFLGFGYYRANLERLGLSQLSIIDSSLLGSLLARTRLGEIGSEMHNRNMRMFLERGYFSDANTDPIGHFRGSAFGLGAAQMKSIQNEWRIGLLDNNSNAIEFLKEYADLS